MCGLIRVWLRQELHIGYIVGLVWVGRCTWRSSVVEWGVSKIDITDMVVLEAKEMLAVVLDVGS